VKSHPKALACLRGVFCVIFSLGVFAKSNLIPARMRENTKFLKVEVTGYLEGRENI
jgi:hypothetical protein